MRNYDLSPLYRSTDWLRSAVFASRPAFRRRERPRRPTRPTTSSEPAKTPTGSRSPWPASPISELSIETRENTLTVRGSKETAQKDEGEKREVLYQGIAARAFERRFQLADHV